jgi:hypothetical protein
MREFPGAFLNADPSHRRDAPQHGGMRKANAEGRVFFCSFDSGERRAPIKSGGLSSLWGGVNRAPNFRT